MTSCATNLIQPTANGGANNETHAKEHLHIGKHGAKIRRELPGYDGETGSKEGRVANRLYDPNDEAEPNEDLRVVKVTQQPKEDGAGAGGEDAQVAHPTGSPCIDLGTDVRAGDEHGELKYAKNKAVLCTRG